MILKSKPVVEISDLTKYYGRNRGIDHINLEIGEGEIFGFIGPNGAGKSTTIRILLNLIFPSGGYAKIIGMDVVREAKAIKQVTGYIPSDASPYPSMTVREFLNYRLRFHKERNPGNRIDELTSLFELEPDRKICDLSRGNLRKVSLVQGFLHCPRLLIMDEPTNGLDPLMQEKFFDLLRSENQKGMTIFFSSHILSEVQLLCRRVAIIKEGQIVRTENMDTLRKKQLKKVHIEFRNQKDKALFDPDGTENLISGPGNALSFLFPGDINRVICSLRGIEVADLTIEEPPLEEIFMHYYH